MVSITNLRITRFYTDVLIRRLQRHTAQSISTSGFFMSSRDRRPGAMRWFCMNSGHMTILPSRVDAVFWPVPWFSGILKRYSNFNVEDSNITVSARSHQTLRFLWSFWGHCSSSFWFKHAHCIGSLLPLCWTKIVQGVGSDCLSGALSSSRFYSVVAWPGHWSCMWCSTGSWDTECSARIGLLCLWQSICAVVLEQDEPAERLICYFGFFAIPGQSRCWINLFHGLTSVMSWNSLIRWSGKIIFTKKISNLYRMSSPWNQSRQWLCIPFDMFVRRR
jgi:hypothetical protein